jgi:hypothetical protein
MHSNARMRETRQDADCFDTSAGIGASDADAPPGATVRDA